MRGERVPQSMAAGAARQTGAPSGIADGAGQRAGIDVMPADVARLGIVRELPRGEQELPAELLSGARIFARQGIGKRDARHAAGQVPLMKLATPGELPLQLGLG